MKRLSSLVGLILASSFVLFTTSSFAAVVADAPPIVSPIAPAAECVDRVGMAAPLHFVESEDLTACDVRLLAATDLCLVPIAMLVGAAEPVTSPAVMASATCSPGLRSPPT